MLQINSPAYFKVIENFTLIRDFTSDPNIEGKVFEVLLSYTKKEYFFVG